MAATTSADETSARVDIGWVARATMAVLARRAISLLALGLPLVSLPSVLIGQAPDEDARIVAFLATVPAAAFTGAASYIAYQDLSGEPAAAASAAVLALRRLPSLWGVAFIGGLFALIGLVLLVIPGLIAMAGFMCGSTAVMAEGMKTGPALERSWQLSRGSRWRLLGLALIGLAALALMVLVLAVLLAVTALGIGMPNAITLSRFALEPLAVLIVSAVLAVGPAAAYANLRGRAGAAAAIGVFA